MSEMKPGTVELVGILNLTPDSFSGDGVYADADKAEARIEELFAEGADIVDIGGEATNPNAEEIDAEEEWRRLEPILERVLPYRPDLSFSLDTRHPQIVHRAAKVAQGVKFYVNDVTTFINPAMRLAVAEHGLHAIMSHLPLAAEGDIQYAHDYLQMKNKFEVERELEHQFKLMVASGILRENIILDPGIGFGKHPSCNWELLEFGSVYNSSSHRRPIMIGYSHKRFLATDRNGFPALEVDRFAVQTNLDAATLAIKASNNLRLLLRVHEVAEHKRHIEQLQAQKPPDVTPDVHKALVPLAEQAS